LIYELPSSLFLSRAFLPEATWADFSQTNVDNNFVPLATEVEFFEIHSFIVNLIHNF